MLTVMPMVPEQVELQQIVLKARPSAEAKDAAQALAARLRDSIVAGADFAAVARAYSSDAVSAREGGDLGWVAPGRFVPPFERAVKALGVNEISEPVDSAWFDCASRAPEFDSGTFFDTHLREHRMRAREIQSQPTAMS